MPKAKRTYLTALQKKAIILLSHNLREHEVSDELGISVHTIRDWVNHHELFNRELQVKIEEFHGIDKEKRREKSQRTLDILYREIARREANGDISKMHLRDIIKSISLLHKEARIDTPGEVTSRTETVRTLKDLQDRFDKSRSGKIFRDNKSTVVVMPRIGKVAKSGSED